MKSHLFTFLFGAVLAGAGVWTWLNHDEAAEEKKDEEHPGEHRVEHTKDGGVILSLEDVTREKIGLKTEPLAGAELASQVRAVGRVLDPEPLGALVSEISAARVSVESAVREFERLKALNAQGQNASTRVLETAEAEAKKSRLVVEGLERRLLGAWGSGIATRKDLPGFVNDLAARNSALMRLDVPQGESGGANFLKASIELPDAADATVEVTLLGPVAEVDPLLRGPGFLAWLPRNPPAVGTVLTGWLSDTTAPRKGVTIPREAIVRHEGRMFAYMELESGRYERREIIAAHPIAAGWFVTGDQFAVGAKIVTQGAQQLLSEELKNSFGEAN